MSASPLLAAESIVPMTTSNRLLVTVRRGASDDSLYRPAGFLTCSDAGYSFAYIRSVLGADDFVPLAGFGDVRRVYTSEHLFPLFGERIMSAGRPDRMSYLDALDLDPDSEPWEILGRSGGRRAGDTIEVLPEPRVDSSGTTRAVFLVHGVGYRGPLASARIADLSPGDELVMRWERDNAYNQRAVLVASDDEIHLGYVPDPLIEFVHVAMENHAVLRVLRANGPRVGPHLRLLVELVGKVPAGYEPFSGPNWECIH